MGPGLGGTVSLLGLPASSTFTFTLSGDLVDGVGISEVSTAYQLRSAITEEGFQVGGYDPVESVYYDEALWIQKGFGINEDVRTEDVLKFSLRYGETVADAVNMASAPTWLPGAIINEVLRIQHTQEANLRSSISAADVVSIADIILNTLGGAISETIGIAEATTIARGLILSEALGLLPTLDPSNKFALTLAQGILLNDSLGRLLGGDISEGVGANDALSDQFRAFPILTDVVNISDVATIQMVIQAIAADTIDISPSDALQSIYSGTIVDGVEISAGFLLLGDNTSGSDGSITTWTMNTRTKGVTEYDNYAFKSFARLGNKYIGASDIGLYELIGDDDAGSDIVARIKSGFAQWAGSRFTIFKGVYLGVRGSGDFVLRLVTGDDKTYDYAIVANNMRTTRVHTGKGLRARYFSFELISTGQDFDLDTIEFIPLVAERRV